MRVLIGFDVGGGSLLDSVSEAVVRANLEPVTVSGSGECDYPLVAFATCRQLLDIGGHSAILICGTGVGMSIAANKIDGIRAARCTDPVAVERARRSNNANVLTMGGEIIGSALASQLTKTWLSHDFDSERSIPKVAMIERLEQSRGRRSDFEI